MKTILSIILFVSLCSCSTNSLPPSLYTSTQIAADVSFVAKQAAPQVSAKTKVAIHMGATQLLALSTGTVTSATLTSIVTSLKISVPPQDQFIVGFVTDAITTGLNWALNHFGEKNPKVVEYTSAVANSLLSSGF